MYDHPFYATRDDETRYAANKILSLLLEKLPPIESAVDIGCGVGTFLSILRDRGVRDILGLDGPWVDKALLAIDPKQFISSDLQTPPKLLKKYDLAICLEVAEHLPGSCASAFVQYLCKAADVILFSAAIPGQGGEGHRNEAWQSYWTEMFNNSGFTLCDFIRPAIWDDKKIYFWYRQNTLVFTKNVDLNPTECPFPIDIVHPELYQSLLRNYDLLLKRYTYFSIFKRLLKQLIKR